MNAVTVGLEFKPGRRANHEIAAALGIMGTCPDFCNDFAATAEYVEFQNRVPFVKPTESGRRICIFDHGDEVHVTREFRKSSQALACMLHFLLSEHKS